MVTTPAMVLSFPEKSTSCREHRVKAPIGTAPLAHPQVTPVSLGHATAVCWERVRAVPPRHKSLPLAVIYPSFMGSGWEGTATGHPG